MSTGLVICSECKHEVHQDGPNHTWRHCEDKSAICVGGHAKYPESESEIRGKWCGRDIMPQEQKVGLREQKVGRNDPCFCGSGKKFKKCHGR